MYSVNREVLPFESGLEAWIYFEDYGAPDIVVADVNLAELSGTELLAKVKSLHPETVVILYSNVPENEDSAMKAGVDAFLAKPFGVSELFDLVQKFIVDGSHNH